jgi:hypothetical protein
MLYNDLINASLIESVQLVSRVFKAKTNETYWPENEFNILCCLNPNDAFLIFTWFLQDFPKGQV